MSLLQPQAFSLTGRAYPDLEEPSVKPGRVQKAGLEWWVEGWRKQSLLIRISLFVQAARLESMNQEEGVKGFGPVSALWLMTNSFYSSAGV